MSRLMQFVTESFPAPKFLTMPAAALDISPNSVKYLDGVYDYKGCLPQHFDEIFLNKGVISKGVIEDEGALIESLKELQQRHKKEFVFVSIPENALYLYTMYIPGRPGKASVLQQIEFTFNEHVPIALEDSVYDFDVVQYSREGTLISVSVAPKAVIAEYERALSLAGFKTRSIELEAYAVARAVTNYNQRRIEGVDMIVDIGYKRAGIIIARNSLPIFTITIPGGSKDLKLVVDECKKQFLFWDTRTNKKGRRVERVTGITICGGSAKEFAKQLEEVVSTDINVANVWQNLFSTEEYIPEIPAKESLAMATLAGLLLNNKRS